MAITRRKALQISGTALTGLSIGAITGKSVLAQGGPAAADDFPDTLVEGPLREGFPADLPLLPDGSAPMHDPSEAGPITDPLMWRTEGRATPTSIDPDPRNMAIRVDTRGLGRLRGTLRFQDLERLPRVEGTYLLQCGAANPRGIVTWSGVRFADFAAMLGLHERVHYCRFTAADGFYADEDMDSLRHRQVMLAWMMNGEPIPADHGAPLRLIMPFRYGNRSVKAITSMMFGTPALPAPTA
jgi:hypothetical protein